jgi:hypothetical protein
MSRNRAYRRYIEEKFVIKRLRVIAFYGSHYRFKDINGISIKNPNIFDYIGTKAQHIAKTTATTRYDTRYKSKYSPNRSRDCWYRFSETREYQKRLFLKILKENGII